MQRRLSITAGLAALGLAISGPALATAPALVGTYQAASPALTWTTTAAAGQGSCSSGAAVLVVKEPRAVTAVSDNTGAVWTQAVQGGDGSHVFLSIWKRMIGSSPITSSTTFSATVATSSQYGMMAVYCLPDATGITTAVDAAGGAGAYTNQPAANLYTGLTTGSSSSIANPSASTSYQIAAHSTYNASANIPGSNGTSTGGWANLVTLTDNSSYGNTGSGLSIAWRQGAGPTTLFYQAGANTYNVLGWAEVEAGAAPPPATVAEDECSLLGVD